MYIVKLIFLFISFFLSVRGIVLLSKLPDEGPISKKICKKRIISLHISCFYDVIIFFFLGSYLSPLTLDVGLEFFLIVFVICAYTALCHYTIYNIKHRIEGEDIDKCFTLIKKAVNNTIFFKTLFIYVEITWLCR